VLGLAKNIHVPVRPVALESGWVKKPAAVGITRPLLDF